jgi:tetratricopeptide (TPR) repeat protein
VPDDLRFATNVAARFGPSNAGSIVIALEPVLGRRPHYFVDVLLGLALGMTGESARGMALIASAILLEPENPLAYQALAIVYVGLDRLEDAERSLEAALARRPGLPEAESELSIVKRKLALRAAQPANVRMAAPQAR